MATFYVVWWQMLLPSGRWNGHCRVGDGLVADVITTRQMVLPWVSVFILVENSLDVKQNLIPYVWQMVFANNSIQG